MAVWNMWFEYNLFENTEWWGRAESIEEMIVNKEGGGVPFCIQLQWCYVKGHYFLVNSVYLNRYKYNKNYVI